MRAAPLALALLLAGCAGPPPPAASPVSPPPDASPASDAVTLRAHPPGPLDVMTWNVCAGTNSVCPLYRADVRRLAETVADFAEGQDLIFLQEFCTAADQPLEQTLEQRTGRPWSVRSWGLTYPGGAPHACHPDQSGGERGVQSIAVAVADHEPRFQTHPLPSPPWYVRRAALCATIAAIKVHACTTHLSSGLAADDHQRGAPYRHRQSREFQRVARKSGHRDIFGGDLNLTGVTVKGVRECDPRGRPTFRERKIDYLFARGVRSCRVGARSSPSDHRPLYLKEEL